MARWRVIILMVALWSCQKDEYFGPVYDAEDSEPIEAADTSYLIGCEGNFQLANASLSIIDPNNAHHENDVFRRANDIGLGDVLNSMYHQDSLIYLVVNNSGEIKIIDDQTYELVGTIDGLSSPRFMHFLNDQEALVSDFGGERLTRVNVSTAEIINYVEAAEWTEQMVEVGGIVYVASMRDSSIYSYDPTSTSLTLYKANIGIEPKFLFSNSERIIVAGNNASGCRIQYSNGEIIYQTDQSLSYAHQFDDVFYLLFGSELILVKEQGNVLKTLKHGLETPYSVYADQDLILLSDVKGYVRRGSVHVLDSDLNFKNDYEVGFIPQAIIRVINK